MKVSVHLRTVKDVYLSVSLFRSSECMIKKKNTSSRFEHVITSLIRFGSNCFFNNSNVNKTQNMQRDIEESLIGRVLIG